MYMLSIFPFLQGANELHIVFLLDILLLILMFLKIHKNKKIILTKDIKFILVLIWAVSYLITIFYSTDTELSFLGFLKFFTVPIFLLTIMQYDYTKEKREKWFDVIPKIGSVMVVLSLILAFIGKSDLVFFQNRLSGFFTYANSFGLFLLIGLIIVAFKKKFDVVDYIEIGILVIGIILTNSRAIMILSAFSYVLAIILNKENRKRVGISFLGLIVVSALTIFLVSMYGVNNRIATGESSEFLLRILYYKDAIRLIAKNIFGYGYMAWWYMQEGFQTGAYDAQFIHNGLLQIAFDVGIIPAICIVVTFIKAFFEKNREIRDKILMLIILGHSLIDFNMEFLAITLVLFMTLEFDKKFEIKNIIMVKSFIVIATGIYAFFALVTSLEKLGKNDVANSLFTYSIALNSELEKGNCNMLEISKKLYEKNKYFLNASDVLGEYEKTNENYEKAYEYELWIVKNKKYTMRNYIEYVSFLSDAIKYYYPKNDIENVKKYVARLNEVEGMIEEVKDMSDELAYKIAHKPRLEVPTEITEYIQNINEFIGSE